MPLTADDDIRELLANARTIALVGASDRPDRPSYGVMKRLQDHGYRVIPVNPQITGEHVHGEFVFRELVQLGDPIDIVDIFRRSEAAGDVVDEAIAIGAKAVWLQLGVVNEAAAARAEAAGLKVVMNRCPRSRYPVWASRRSGRTDKAQRGEARYSKGRETMVPLLLLWAVPMAEGEQKLSLPRLTPACTLSRCHGDKRPRPIV